jgi:hypothetical protein
MLPSRSLWNEFWFQVTDTSRPERDSAGVFPAGSVPAAAPPALPAEAAPLK